MFCVKSSAFIWLWLSREAPLTRTIFWPSRLQARWYILTALKSASSPYKAKNGADRGWTCAIRGVLTSNSVFNSPLGAKGPSTSAKTWCLSLLYLSSWPGSRQSEKFGRVVVQIILSVSCHGREKTGFKRKKLAAGVFFSTHPCT
jgi:hypothetical protein